MLRETFFPEIVTNLPEAGTPIEGLHSYFFQGEHQQITFMSFRDDAEIPEHCHEAQWGVVLDDEMELAVDDKKPVFTEGDTYFVPKDVMHSAKIKKGYKDITLFNEKDRYEIRESHPNST